MNIRRRKGFMATAVLLILCLVFFGCINDPAGGINPGDGTETGSETDPGGGTDPGTTDPGTTDPVTTDPGTTDPGTTDPGTTDPGTTDPGTTDPGTTDPGQNTVYTVKITISDDETGDAVTASPSTGIAGVAVTLTYTVANTAHYNLLEFDGVNLPIASVDRAGSGTRTYTIDGDDASNGVITIIAIFNHTDLTPDPIAFNETGHITKTYGEAFTNAITNAHKGSGAITYSSSDTTVVTVNNSGQVTIHKVGEATITAEKAADTEYAHAQTSYTLEVEPKSVTITGLSVLDKVYDGTTTATVNGSMGQINGSIYKDVLTIISGTAEFEDAEVGNNKTVTFSGWSLGGKDAGNYTLSAQPASVTANITAATPPSIIEVVLITGGTFTMGSPSTETGRSSDETQRSITLGNFYIGKYQVTQEQYQEVMGTNPSSFKSAVTNETETPGKLPVENVTWFDAVEFCNKLSEKEGLEKVYTFTSRTPATGYPITNLAGLAADFNKNGYRLPSEAQWEYACRAGTTEAYNNGNNSYTNAASVGAVAWYTGNSGNKTHQVGLKDPNAWGLYDMHGNVFEWCRDWYGNYSSTITTDPPGPNTGTDRVMRGGGWDDRAQDVRSALRYSERPNTRNNNTGFRVVRP